MLNEFIESGNGSEDLPCNMARVSLFFDADDEHDSADDCVLAGKPFLQFLVGETSNKIKAALVAITSSEMRQFKLAKDIAAMSTHKSCLVSFKIPGQEGPLTVMIFRIRR